MPVIAIQEAACRGCQMCVDVCPTDVFVYDDTRRQATIAEPDDCIACLSCAYDCPSGAITHDEYHAVRNFYRDLEFCRRMERYL